MATGNGQQAAQAPAREESQLALFKRTVIDVTADKVRGFLGNGELTLPADYVPENAMKSAWLMLQEVKDRNSNPALSVCETSSVASAMLDMVVQGLNPMKKQCYFIVYDKHLACQRSYFGDMAMAMRADPRIKDFSYSVIYEGDEFSINILHGQKEIVEHKQSFKNMSNATIAGAYAEALDENNRPISGKTEIMTVEQIHQSWKKSKTNPFDDKGNLKPTSNHAMYPVEYAIRTVIRKLCKPIINKSSDSELLKETMRRSEDDADRAELAEKMKAEANQGPVLEVVARPVQALPEVGQKDATDTITDKVEEAEHTATGKAPF